MPADVVAPQTAKPYTAGQEPVDQDQSPQNPAAQNPAADDSPALNPPASASMPPEAGDPEPASAAPTGHMTAAQAAAAKAIAAQARAAHDTGAEVPLAADEIRALRVRIDEIDQAIIDLWQERSRLSQQVGKTRMASGGTRLVLSREREIVERFRAALGPDGTQVALLLLRSGRGPL